MPTLTHEVVYLLLIFALVVVPRALQRFRIPAPLTSFGFGMLAAGVLGASSQDATLSLLSTLGISSLFLFAGLEIEPADLARGRWPLLGHLAVRALALAGVVYASMSLLSFDWRASALLALAILTPSTGFILETLPALGLGEEERYWVRIKAVTGELFALAVLFVVLQSGSAWTLAWSAAALAAMVVGIPALFVLLGRTVAPFAHGSEFSLLVMVGVIAAAVTNWIGVEYLVGAFVAGFVARLLRSRMPLLASDGNLHAIRMFASFFVPFYFFHKGASVPAGALTWQSLLIGLVLTAVGLPARVGLVWTQRRFIRGETPASSLRVAAALAPTLIFTLVLAEILRERFAIPDQLYGALLVYAGMTTLLPSFVLARPIEFDVPPEPDRPPERRDDA